MPSEAIAGVGTQFKRSDAGVSAGDYVAIAEVNSINGPTMSRDFIDVTSLDSTGGYREFIGGFRDGGEVTLNMNFTLSSYNLMLDDYNDPDYHYYMIVLPDSGNTTISFAAFVTDLPLSVTPDDKVTIDVTLKVTGQVTLDT